MPCWPQKSKLKSLGLLALLPILFNGVILSAQNRVLVISEYESQIGSSQRLDSILTELNYQVIYDNTIPVDLTVQDYSLLIIGGISGDNCFKLQDYLAQCGGIILTSPAPNVLFSNCEETADVAGWLGFDYYMNGSGDLVAATDLTQIGLVKDSLLDRTACGMSFGGLMYPRPGAEVLANWVCPVDNWTVAAVTRMQSERGKVYYFSRPLSALRSRQLFSWAIADAIEYRWGDADNSDRVNLTDAIFIIQYVFQGSGVPVNRNAADPNGDGSINVSDAVYLISYIFTGGNAPLAGRVD